MSAATTPAGTRRVALGVDRLVAGYDGHPVIHELSLEVGEGEIVALLGPNGAGKTTTLSALSGLVPIMSGAVRLGGAALAARAPHRIARAGLIGVPEGRSLVSNLTVAEHFRLSSNSGAAARLDQAVEWFPQLGPLLHRKVGVLSGGEQQQLAVARALSERPAVVTIDEMSLGLAPLVVESMLTTLRDVVDDSGCGVLLVEQHVEMALGVADRAYVLDRGVCVARGSASELLADPDALRAAYLGGG